MWRFEGARRLGPLLAALLVACARPELPSPGDDSGPGAGEPADSDSAVADSAAAPTAMCPLRPDGRMLRDAAGRAVFLRGINVSNAAKYDPQHVGEATAEGMKQIASLGFNTVRLLTFWGAVMTAPEGAGVDALRPDPAYLQRLDAMIARAADAGLMVVLDMHQDIFGFGFGDNGAPPAGCDSARYEGYHPAKPWFANYLNDKVQACFDALYADTPYRAAMAKAWRLLAERYKDDSRIVAFDLMNEPSTGSRLLTTFLPAHLLPFFRVMIDAVRSADPHRLVFVEPAPAIQLNAAVDTAPIGRPGVGWAPHHYHLLAHQGMAYDPDTRELLIDASIDGMVARGDEVVGTAPGGRGPIFMGEFGAPEVPGVVTLMHDVLDRFDLHLLSWATWSYDRGGFGIRDKSGTLRGDYLRAIARPHVRAVAGTPTRIAWDGKAGELTVTWSSGPADTGATELWAGLSAARLAGETTPTAVAVSSTDPEGAWSWEQDHGVVRIHHDPSRSEHTAVLRPL